MKPFLALVRKEFEFDRGVFGIQAWGNYQNELFYDIQNSPVSREITLSANIR